MEGIGLIVLLIFMFSIPVLFALWVIYLFYKIPAKSGQKKTGIILSSITGFIFTGIIALFVFEDDFLSNEDAAFWLEQHGFDLNEEFDVIDNDSGIGIGESFHNFSLKISDRDKATLIKRIKNDTTFFIQTKPLNRIDLMTDRHFGETVRLYYESDCCYIYDFFEPSGQKGYSPTHEIITIYKEGNWLSFLHED